MTLKNGQITVYYGEGRGKTSVAIGRGIRALGEELRVVMIQFLDYRDIKELELLKHFEPEFRIFRFEKERDFENMQANSNQVITEIKNAMYFSNKIMDTGECEVFMLDGILECVGKGYLEVEAVVELLRKRPENMDVLLTGDCMPDGLIDVVDSVFQINLEK